jgi:hypothetical protein
MNDLSTLANMAEILGVIIVVGGLFFAVLQMRQIRQQRRELAAIELFRFFGNPRFTRAYQLLLHLPDGLATDDTRTKQKDLEDAAMLVSSTMENIGVMTFQRIVPFVIVNNLIGSSVIASRTTRHVTRTRRMKPTKTGCRHIFATRFRLALIEWLIHPS